MYLQTYPPGYVVGIAPLQVHLFTPAVSEFRAEFIDLKARRLVSAINEDAENIVALQMDFRLCLDVTRGHYFVMSGHECLGDHLSSGIMDGFQQLCLVSDRQSPHNFPLFWRNYLFPLVSRAVPAELDTMRRLSTDNLWAAMVAENMGESIQFSETSVGCAVVTEWSVFPDKRTTPCYRCIAEDRVCLDTGCVRDLGCRNCLIEGLQCEPLPSDLKGLKMGMAYILAGIDAIKESLEDVEKLCAEASRLRGQLYEAKSKAF